MMDAIISQDPDIFIDGDVVIFEKSVCAQDADGFAFELDRDAEK